MEFGGLGHVTRDRPAPFDDGQELALGQLQRENRALRAMLEGMRARLAELERLADSDALTPLANRRAFLRNVTRALSDLERHAIPAALLYVDVNRLKAINDAYGHAAGDAALLHIARLLTESTRGGDLAGRLGGDEFAILLNHVELAAAQETAGRIAATVADRPLGWGSEAIDVAVSIGVTMLRRGDSAEEAIARADRAMYGTRQGLRGRG